MILSGDRISGAEAAEWGLAYRSYPAAELEDRAAEMAGRLAGKDRDALARIKRLIRDGLERPLADGLEMELDAVLEHLSGDRADQGISEFTGRTAAR